MTKKHNISQKILKVLSQKKVIGAIELKQRVFPIQAENKNEKTPKEHYAITRAVKNLKSGGFVDIFYSEHDEYIRLTSEGIKKFHFLNTENTDALVNLNWDGFWRIILLDIGEDRKNERDAVRYLLKKAGFVCLKNSVWISPYPYEHLFTNIKNDLKFTTEMMIIVTNNLDKETRKEVARVYSGIK